MSKFNLELIGPADSEFKPTIDPGIHEVKLIAKSKTTPEDPKKSAYYSLNMQTLNGSMVYEMKFYLSEKSIPISLKNAKHIVTKVASQKELDSCKGETEEQLLESILSVLVGKSLRMKFSGEEYINDKGQLKMRTIIGRPNFAESLNEKESALRFDKNNKYDISRIPSDQIIPQPEIDGQGKLNDLRF